MSYEIVPNKVHVPDNATSDPIATLRSDIEKSQGYLGPFEAAVIMEVLSRSVTCKTDEEFDQVQIAMADAKKLMAAVETARKSWKAIPLAQSRAVDDLFNPVKKNIEKSLERYGDVWAKYKSKKQAQVQETYQKELAKQQEVGTLEPPKMLINAEITSDSVRQCLGWECIINGQASGDVYTIQGTVKKIDDDLLTIQDEQLELWLLPLSELSSIRALPKAIDPPPPPPDFGSIKSSDGTTIYEVRRWEFKLTDPLKFAKAVASTAGKFEALTPDMLLLNEPEIRKYLASQDEARVPELKVKKHLANAGIEAKKVTDTRTRTGGK